jgi:single-stranded DNA-specific DHH superfamily exonuclease
MRRVDVCNGDADGLCAVLQWRLAHPQPAMLVSGLKREIELLQRVSAGAGDEVLVCDLSMQRNRPALLRLLALGAQVRYFDHHQVDDVPRHPGLQASIDFDARVCTSLLVDRALGARFRPWALVGAYGDNLSGVADALAAEAGFSAPERTALRRLGEAINYNAYGDEPRDQHIAPAPLFAILQRHAHPLDLLRHDPIGAELDALRRADLQQARAHESRALGEAARLQLLPDAPWSRRVIGILANQLASAEPQRAHAVLKADGRGGHVVSLRAPTAAAGGADAFCRRFGGGGRAGAAGIDHLPASELPRFMAELAAARWAPASGAAPA